MYQCASDTGGLRYGIRCFFHRQEASFEGYPASYECEGGPFFSLHVILLHRVVETPRHSAAPIESRHSWLFRHES